MQHNYSISKAPRLPSGNLLRFLSIKLFRFASQRQSKSLLCCRAFTGLEMSHPFSTYQAKQKDQPSSQLNNRHSSLKLA
jgi:hypothetical protein